MTWSCDWLSPAVIEPAPASHCWVPGELAASPQLPALDEPELDESLEAAWQEDARQLAFEDGRIAGVREGRAAERARVDSAIAMLTAATAELQAAREPWLRQIETLVVALAAAIARHVIEREVRTDPGIVADLVRRALAEFPPDEPVRIRVHPEDLSALGERKLAPGRQVQWLADGALAQGGCVVEGVRRVVDGRVEPALERIYRKLSNG